MGRKGAPVGMLLFYNIPTSGCYRLAHKYTIHTMHNTMTAMTKGGANVKYVLGILLAPTFLRAHQNSSPGKIAILRCPATTCAAGSPRVPRGLISGRLAVALPGVNGFLLNSY